MLQAQLDCLQAGLIEVTRIMLTSETVSSQGSYAIWTEKNGNGMEMDAAS